MILAADVGGTKTNIGYFEVRDSELEVVVEARYASRDFESLDRLASQFVTDHQLEPTLACFGIAGPCRDGVCEATNLPWRADAYQLASELKIDQAWVINDLEATAYSLSRLSADELAPLQEGHSWDSGNQAVLAAGTGLGEAGVVFENGRRIPFACEGGHSDFACRDELEAGLLLFLQQKFGHVAWERILSGAGIQNLYEYLSSRAGARPSKDVADRMENDDPAAVITQAALDRECPVCVAALDRFVSLYGAEAGNLALKFMATGGVFIGGGIAPKILPALRSEPFRESFVNKGRFRSVLEKIPVKVILTNRAALLGAAHCAMSRGGLEKRR